MPIYAYRCTNCGHAQDVLQKISDPVLTVCPVCGHSTYAKQVTAAGFQLKGSGWYVTDFRGDGKGGKAKGDDAAGEKSPSSEAGGDAKKADAAAPSDGGKKSDAGASPAAAPAPVAAAPSPAPAPASAASPSPARSGKAEG